MGVGDSLTAGVQSDGLLGADISPNPLGSASTEAIVPNTQGKGYFARIWSQANGGANAIDPATSVLPLMAAPGLGQILVQLKTGFLSGLIADCTGPDAVATTYSTALQTRINPSTKPYDLGVSGQTLNEALTMTAPFGPCSGAGVPAGAVVQPEDVNFYPVLGNFPQGMTQVQAAVSLKPTLAIVWLGSNDLLKYLDSNGQYPAVSGSQFQTAMTTVITQLQGAGAKVAVSNLVDVEDAAYFSHVSLLPQLFALSFGPSGITAPEAAQLAAGVQSFIQGAYGLGNNGLLTLSGYGKTVGAVTAFLQANGGLTLQQALSAPSAALVAGDFVLDAIASNGATLNAAYNASIANAAAQTGAALVDTHALFAQYVTAGGYIAFPSNPKCCYIGYGGGATSLDGLHPSDTLYALAANNFIARIDSAYGANIPQLTASQLAAINASDVYSPH